MDFAFDFNIIGEILIPLETNLSYTNTQDQYKDINNIFNKTISNFRSIIFQHELLRFFIFIKLESMSESITQSTIDIAELFKDIDITLEFCFPNITTDTTTPIDNKSRIKFITDLIDDFPPLVNRKLFIKETNTVIMELTKRIIIPNQYINSSLMLKIDLIKKADSNYINHIPLNQILYCDNYQNIPPKEIIKTLFKEVKVIQPFNVYIKDQIYFTPDKSIVQITIENTTSTINYLDQSLKRSKCLNKPKDNNSIDNDITDLTYSFPIEINHIELKLNETKESNPTISFNSLNQLLSTMTINHINSLPIIISPGETNNITIVLERNRHLYDLLSSNYTVESIKEYTETNSAGSFFSVFTILKSTITNENLNQNTKTNAKEHKSIHLLTQVNLSLKCNEDIYRGIFISLYASWSYEYNDSMYINFAFNDEELIVNKMTTMNMTIKNITKSPMDISIEMSTSFEDVHIDKLELRQNQAKYNSNFPSFIAENKMYSVGKIESNQQKEINIRLLAVKAGLNNLQDFVILDLVSNKKYTVFNTNTIFIKDK